MFVPRESIRVPSSGALPETVRKLKAEIASKEKLISLWFSKQTSGAKTATEVEPHITQLNSEIIKLRDKLKGQEQAIRKLEKKTLRPSKDLASPTLMMVTAQKPPQLPKSVLARLQEQAARPSKIGTVKLAHLKEVALRKPAPLAKEVLALSPQLQAAAKRRPGPPAPTLTQQKISETHALLAEAEKLKEQIEETISQLAYKITPLPEDKQSLVVALRQLRSAAANINVLKNALQALEHQNHIDEIEAKITKSKKQIQDFEGKIQTSPNDLTVIIPLVLQKEKEEENLQSLEQQKLGSQDALRRSMQALPSAGDQMNKARNERAEASKIVEDAVQMIRPSLEKIRTSSKSRAEQVNPNAKENVQALQNRKGAQPSDEPIQIDEPIQRPKGASRYFPTQRLPEKDR